MGVARGGEVDGGAGMALRGAGMAARWHYGRGDISLVQMRELVRAATAFTGCRSGDGGGTGLGVGEGPRWC